MVYTYSLESVSYTHLDVYKRQFLFNQKQPGFEVMYFRTRSRNLIFVNRFSQIAKNKLFI